MRPSRPSAASSGDLAPEFLPPVPERLPPRVVEALLADGGQPALTRALERAGGYLVEDGPSPETCTVVLSRPVTAERQSAVAVIDTITHMHSGNLAPFVLERLDVNGVSVHAAAFVLPRGLRASTGLLVVQDLDVRVGEDRAAWRALQRRSEPLTTAAEVLSVNGARSSVLSLPGALPQPFIEATVGAKVPTPADPGEDLHQHRMHSVVLGMDIDCWCHSPHAPSRATTRAASGTPCTSGASRSHRDAPENLLILLDGDTMIWRAPVLPALERACAVGALPPTATVLFAPADRAERANLLGMNPRLPDFIADELLPWASRLSPLPADPVRRAIAGASLGGLAAADVVRRAPKLVANAIVQSGSFWWPASARDGPEHLQLRLWEEHRPGPLPVRLFQEVGSLEGHLRADNRRFRDIVRARGFDLAYREYCGGHDYACWRGGVVDGLLHLFGPRPGPPDRSSLRNAAGPAGTGG